jgi:predicted nucleic acid-binding protein
MIIISDTSPLVCLLHLNKINILKDLFVNVIIPTTVFNELIRAKIIDETFLQFNQFIQLKTPLNKKEVEELRKVLDAGESEAIVLSKELNADLLLIDEDRGRKFAIKYGIRIRNFRSITTGKRKKINWTSQAVN